VAPVACRAYLCHTSFLLVWAASRNPHYFPTRRSSDLATAKGIYADALFAGTLWLTNDLNIESPDGYLNITGDMFRMVSKNDLETYTIIENGGIEARGKFDRTWRGTTKTHDVSLRFENGYIRSRNNTDQLSTYLSDFGFS